MISNNFIQRSIMGALAFFKELIFADQTAARAGFLQSLDPRVKAGTFLMFVIKVSLERGGEAIFFLYALCLLLAAASKINLGFFLKRTWIFIPLFSLFIVIPSVFSKFTPGETLAGWNILGLSFAVSRSGLNNALVFVMRVATSVSFVVLLGATTRHFELLRVLRIFKVPQIFVMTLGICYRYIYLFVETVEQFYLAVKSRVGVFLNYRKGQGIAVWGVVSLWQRSVKLSDEVYRAMLSRGYQGEALVENDFRYRLRDWLWLFAASIILWMI